MLCMYFWNPNHFNHSFMKMLLFLFRWPLKFMSCSLIVIVNLSLYLARTKEMIAQDYDNEETGKEFKF